MRSLTIKLTLAFLLVGVTGALLVALFVALRTQSDFNQFVMDRYRTDLVNELTSYYQQNGSWQGLGTIMMRNPYPRAGAREFVPAPVVLTDASGVVMHGGRRYQAGDQLSRQEINKGLKIVIDGETVGRILLDTPVEGTRTPPQSPEDDFLARFRQAVFLSALAAGIIALFLGVLLARTISRPVRDLTEGTQRVAQGQLGHQVPVRTQDELGELAASFNQMSSDLARMTQQRRQMTADIAHELRTPLSVVLGYTEALSDGKLPGTPAVFETMHGEARLLSHLIDDLRTLSLVEAGELPLNRQPCRPQAILERTAAAHAALADQKDIALVVDAGPDLPAISVDRERMAQVLGNLVSNALRYTQAGGQIRLSATAGQDQVLLRVQDTGQGIAPEELPLIFDRFYRGDKSRSQVEGESGLGLAIAKSIVEAHDGRIGVESAMGSGTTFTITLPRLAEDTEILE